MSGRRRSLWIATPALVVAMVAAWIVAGPVGLDLPLGQRMVALLLPLGPLVFLLLALLLRMATQPAPSERSDD